MKSILCLLAVSLVAAEVLVLTDSNFADTLKANDANGILVKFYAPWCGHCKAMAPEYDKAAKALGTDGVRLAKIDCTEHKEVCNQEGVKGYPTVKFFAKGSVVDYDSGRDAESIQKWLKKKTAPTPVVQDKEALDNFVASAKRTIVAFLTEKAKDESTYQHWSALTRHPELNDFEFAETFNKDLFDFVGLDKTQDSFVVYTSGSKTAVFDGDFSQALDFIDDNAFPLITDIQENRFPKLAQKKKFVVVLFTGENSQTEIDLLAEVGKKYSDSLGFISGVGSQYAQHASMLGISGKVFPILVGIKGDKYFPSEESKEFTKENVDQFLNELSSGKMKANFKSEPVEPQSGPVFKVVGNNFEDEVFKADKHVFLKFYAPWCGHCKNLAPTWDKLGEKFDGTDVRIAKIDATANDHPIQGVQGFPTLKFFPKGDKENPIDYDGGRTLEDLTAFVKKHAVEDLSGFVNKDLKGEL